MQRSVLRAQKLANPVHCGRPLQFLWRVLRRIAKRSPVGNAKEKSLLKETIHRGHDRGICLPDRAILAYFANSSSSSAPDRLENFSLQRSKLRRRGSAKRMKGIHCLF